MDGETPTFCKELLFKKGCSFSSAIKKTPNSKFNKSESLKKPLKKGGSIKLRNQSKFKKDNLGLDIKYKKRKVHHSQKIKLKDINNIHDFIKNHKFKLRNDFDKKHVEKFLSSKEEAFKIPFLLTEEMSSTTIKS